MKRAAKNTPTKPVKGKASFRFGIQVFFSGSIVVCDMPAFTHHIFICCNRRTPDHPRGCCDPDASDALRTAFKAELKSRQLGPLVRANKSGCLEQCEHGPTVAIYPQGIFYGGVMADDVPRIIEETVIGGRVVESLRIADACLNNRDCEHIRAGRETGGTSS